MKSPEILALGEPLIEMVRLPDRPDGRVLYEQGVAGDTLTAAVRAARQGVATGYLSAVGDNALGRAIFDFCDAEGVDATHVHLRPNQTTGINVVDPDPTARQFSYARQGSAASRYVPEDLPEEAIAAAKVLHVSAVSQAISPSMRASVERAAEVARAHGTLVSYDFNLRLALWSLEDAHDCILGFLPYADILLPSDDEAALLFGTEEPGAVLDALEGFAAQHIILKRGAKGAVYSDGAQRVTVPAKPVCAVDSTGAGDTLAGVFLAEIVKGASPINAVELAVDKAADAVSGYGALA